MEEQVHQQIHIILDKKYKYNILHKYINKWYIINRWTCKISRYPSFFWIALSYILEFKSCNKQMMNSIILRMTLLILSWFVTTKQNNMIQISSFSYVLFFTHIPPLHWNQRCKITPKTLWTVGKVTPFLHVQVVIIYVYYSIASVSTKHAKIRHELVIKI